MAKIEILGVGISRIGLAEVLAEINRWISGVDRHYIVTVNPEFIVEAQEYKGFKQVLNNATIATCDGVGLVWASGGKLIRVTGVDLTQKLLNSINFIHEKGVIHRDINPKNILYNIKNK